MYVRDALDRSLVDQSELEKKKKGPDQSFTLVFSELEIHNVHNAYIHNVLCIPP